MSVGEKAGYHERNARIFLSGHLCSLEPTAKVLQLIIYIHYIHRQTACLGCFFPVSCGIFILDAVTNPVFVSLMGERW